MSTVLDALAELRATLASLPPKPYRLEMTDATLTALRAHVATTARDLWTFEMWDAVPIITVDDVPHGKARACFPDGTTTLIDPTARHSPHTRDSLASLRRDTA